MPPSRMHSIDEVRLKRILKEGHGASWREYNRTHLTRIYPGGLRVRSDNYNPLLAWSLGNQMVALNFQKDESAMYLNRGRFRQNGHCGYVLKPAAVMGDRPPPKTPRRMRIRVLSGSCLPKIKLVKKGESVDTYIVLKLYDIMIKNGKEKTYTSKRSTEIVCGNGFSPVWDETKTAACTFSVNRPDVAMLEVKILCRATLDSVRNIATKVCDVANKVQNVAKKESGLHVIGVSTYPISCLRQGYRSLKFCDKNGCRTGLINFARLLVKVEM
mmetsp:Transcript_29882/g.68560  ORF Transcript_29882/g.68560 Transcript_29882/m.68560 type:complete len:271 (-) Transcript_29882:219-1031(-)